MLWWSYPHEYLIQSGDARVFLVMTSKQKAEFKLRWPDTKNHAHNLEFETRITDVVKRFTSSIPAASNQALFVCRFKVRLLSSHLTFTMRLSNWPWISPSLPPQACPEYFEYLSGLACLVPWTFISCVLCLPQQPTWQSPALSISDSLLPVQIHVILLSSTTNSKGALLVYVSGLHF